MQRIVVLGTSGSGKTTVARQLAAVLKVPHIELDALYWGENWTPAEPDTFRQRVRAALAEAHEGWIVCGNYHIAKEEIWPHADTAIWLDYPMRLVFTRVLMRTLRRSVSGETLWSGNRESLWGTFCSRDSILLWVINTWRLRRRDYPRELSPERWPNLRMLRFRSPHQTETWLSRVE